MSKQAFRFDKWPGIKGKGLKAHVQRLWQPGMSASAVWKQLVAEGVDCKPRVIQALVAKERDKLDYLPEPSDWRAKATNARWGGSGGDPNFETPTDFPDWSMDIEESLDDNRTVG